MADQIPGPRWNGYVGAVQVRSGTAAFAAKHKAASIGIDSAASYALKFNQNGTIVTVLSVNGAPTGGDTGKGAQITVSPVTGTAGLRQGALNISLTRASGAPITTPWDGNPDTALKIISRNSANNTVGGATRALDIQARNSSSCTETWVQTAEINARNDGTIDTLTGVHIRAENYGTVNDAIVGLDIEMSSENDTSSPTKDAILVRNTDLSGMTVVGSVIKLTNTSTNGFGALLNMDGLTAASGTIVSTTGTAAATFAARIRVITPNGSAGWINVYSVSNE